MDDTTRKPPRTLPAALRYLLLVFAALCVALGIIGIFVPGLPTTVFILIAGWAAARSSPRFAAWLENHETFGPMIRDWRERGAVSRRAKIDQLRDFVSNHLASLAGRNDHGRDGLGADVVVVPARAGMNA
jgi:uncharacterized membrane protein YbaN (DUF454 family)